MADYFFDEEEESNENIEVKDDIYNYKGYFVENEEEEEEKKFYEFGAHFPYMYLYQQLEILAQEREQQQKELEKKLMQKERESLLDPATNEKKKTNENLKGLLNIFQQNGKSRNREDVDIGLTYVPKMKNKINHKRKDIETVSINLMKSTSGQNQDENKENKKTNIINKKNDLNNYFNNSNSKNKNCANKNDNKKNLIKNISKTNKQMKVRKRNEINKLLNINNSLSNNTYNINKTKYREKINSQNMTHNVQYTSKLKNNLVNKLKSIKFSKERIRNQIINTGNIEQRLSKKLKMNNVLKKNRNKSNKWLYSKCYGYQNTKNISSSKNVLSKNKTKKRLLIAKQESLLPIKMEKL